MKLRFALCLLLVSSAMSVASASTITVDYANLPTSIYASGITFQGITLTASNNIFSSVLGTFPPYGEFRGLGVQGGFYDDSLDIGEILTLTYNQRVNNVTLTVFDLLPVGNALLGFTAYDGAANLGFFTFPYATNAPQMYSVSSVLGNHPITSIALTEVSGAPAGFTIRSTTFDTLPATAPVPEPSSFLLLATGLVSVLRLRNKLCN